MKLLCIEMIAIFDIFILNSDVNIIIIIKLTHFVLLYLAGSSSDTKNKQTSKENMY